LLQIGTLVSLRTFAGTMASPGSLILPPIIGIPYILYYRQKDILIRWSIRITNPIYNDMRIRMKFSTAINFGVGSTCEIYHKNSSLHKYNKCSFSIADNYFDFIIGECNGCPMKEGDFIIYHYGNFGPESNTGERIATTVKNFKNLMVFIHSLQA
jgi:hypothetical protein